MPRPRPSPSSDLKRRLQRAVFWLVLLVVLVDAAALGAYRVLDLEHASKQTRLAFTVVWMLATLAVVLPSMWRVRALRDQVRRRRR